MRLPVWRLKWLLRPLLLVLLLPIAGCGSILALLIVHSAVNNIPSNVIRVARKQGGLAPLPPSAADIRTEGWSNGFASGRYIRFKARPEEIEEFLSTSPGLKRVTPEVFTPRHMYLPYPKVWPSDDQALEEHVRHKYFSRRPHPDWYNPTIRTKGRRFAIPWHGEGYWGEVVVDDVIHLVFIHTAYS